MFDGPIRGGTRGGQGEFKWSDVSADKDRENYLGHSINAPTGRWQKNKDVHWYNRDNQSSEVERLEEIRKIQEVEADALAVALGFKPAVRPAPGTESVPATDEKSPTLKDPSIPIPKEETRQLKEERREERRKRREERRERRERKALKHVRNHDRLGSTKGDHRLDTNEDSDRRGVMRYYASSRSRSRSPGRREARSPSPNHSRGGYRSRDIQDEVSKRPREEERMQASRGLRGRERH